MLRIKKVSCSNFRCFKDFSMSMPESGLYYLEGTNSDDSFSSSNGSGKSTFMEIPSMCLWGRGLRDSDRKSLTYKDSIRLHCRSARLEIELKSDTGEEYIVTREITDKRSNLTLRHGNDILLNQFAVDYLQDKLDLSFNSFISSSLFGQGRYESFNNATETEKMSLLEELFKLKEIDDIRKQLKQEYDDLGDTFFEESKELSFLQAEYKSAETKSTLLQDLYTKDRHQAESVLNSTIVQQVAAQLEDCIVTQKRKLSYLNDISLKITSMETVLDSGSWSKSKTPLKAGEPCPTCRQVVQANPEYDEWLERQNKKQIEFNEIQQQLGVLKKERGNYESDIQSLDMKIFEVTKEKEQLEKEIARANEVLGLSERLINEAIKTYEDAGDEYHKQKIKVDELQKKRDNLSELRNILGEKELRGCIVGNYLDLINYYAKKYVSFLTNGELSIEFKFISNKIEGKVIRHRDNWSQPYVSFSGGEKSRLDFAVFLSFNQVNRHVLKQPLQILFLDETFRELDSVGTEKAIELLKAEKDNFGLILCTGHTQDLADMFQDSIKLVKRQGQTVLA